MHELIPKILIKILDEIIIVRGIRKKRHPYNEYITIDIFIKGSLNEVDIVILVTKDVYLVNNL